MNPDALELFNCIFVTTRREAVTNSNKMQRLSRGSFCFCSIWVQLPPGAFSAARGGLASMALPGMLGRSLSFSLFFFRSFHLFLKTTPTTSEGDGLAINPLRIGCRGMCCTSLRGVDLILLYIYIYILSQNESRRLRAL